MSDEDVDLAHAVLWDLGALPASHPFRYAPPSDRSDFQAPLPRPPEDRKPKP